MCKKINLLIIFGTRPEAIKLAPVILESKKHADKINLKICITGQHKEMLDQVLNFFEIRPHINLNIMKKNQSLADLSSKLIKKLGTIIDRDKTDLILVQGDTTSAFIAGLVAYYKGIKVGHVEAGLRTNDRNNPFPEELNRQLISRIADYHFAPTESARENLLRENISNNNIMVVGNTIIDALLFGIGRIKNSINKDLIDINRIIDRNKRIILVTCHRRESFGENFNNICLALKEIADNNEDIQIVYQVHLNPNVKKPAYSILKNSKNIFLIDPLSYKSFIWLLSKSYLIITDSGGIQEEAPSLGKPVLVIRKRTERNESLNLKFSKLIGLDKKEIVKNVNEIINNENLYQEMIPKINPYGDGRTSERIINFIIGIK
jgi:UDP-N-acetylglucosamine 2-epimerase (non-hydrolysing)